MTHRQSSSQPLCSSRPRHWSRSPMSRWRPSTRPNPCQKFVRRRAWDATRPGQRTVTQVHRITKRSARHLSRAEDARLKVLTLASRSMTNTLWSDPSIKSAPTASGRSRKGGLAVAPSATTPAPTSSTPVDQHHTPHAHGRSQLARRLRGGSATNQGTRHDDVPGSAH